jgi:hypothetical protein
MSKLTTRAFDMAGQENCDGEEYDMIQELAEHIAELERRIVLVRELKYANYSGFIDDALDGVDVEAINLGSQTMRECLDNFKRNEGNGN